MTDRRHIIISILLLILLSSLIMLKQLITDGFFSCVTMDTYQYTSWAWQFIEALKEGIVYPRWLPLNFWGYGSPTFILYPPLAFYLVAFFNIFTKSVIMAMNITKFLALFLSGVGMFFLVKEFYSGKVALLTAFFYIVIPFNIFQFYYRGTFASTISFIWFAPIVFFTYKYIKNKHLKYIIYAGLCYGGLILTHLINAYMFTFVIVAFIITMSVTERKPKALLTIPLIIIIGIALSTAYVLPVIYEKRFVNYKYLVGEGGGYLFDFHRFFILPNMTNLFLYDHIWPIYYDTFIFFVLFFSVLILLIIRKTLKLSHNKTLRNVNITHKFFLSAAIFSLFLLFGPSKFIWETVPYFEYIQFPIRWLNITAFAVVFVFACLMVSNTMFRTKRIHFLFIACIFLLCLLLDYKYIHSSCFIPKQELIPVKIANWSREHIPRGVNIDMINNSKGMKEKITIIKGEGQTKVIDWRSICRIVEITAHGKLTLGVRTFYFPGWKAYIDGVQTEIKTEQGTGAILIDIPEGKHGLVLKFEDTPIRYYSKLLSLISFFVIILLALIYHLRSKKKILYGK